MRTTNSLLLRICAEKAAVLGLLLLVILAVSGCFAAEPIVPVPPTETPIALLSTEVPPPTATPVPTAPDFPLPAPTRVTAAHQGYQTCVQCHTSEARLKEALAVEEGSASNSDVAAWAGELSPVEGWQAVFIDDPAFLETIHGRYGCVSCHGGTRDTLLKEVAHTGLIREPSTTDLCADCHPQEVSTAGYNLHASLNGYREVLSIRSGLPNSSQLETAIEEHCDSCHTATCGQCHVSRPAGIGGGLVAGHDFGDVRAINMTCAGCHGSRIEAEYKNPDGGGQGDVHWIQAKMLCTDCHATPDFHGTEVEHLQRYDGAPDPDCDNLHCHPDVTESDGIEQHAGVHLKSLSCQACHATAYRNCYGCHLQQGGSAGFTLRSTQVAFKIGRNPIQSGYRPWKYVPVRHVPITEDTFSDYGQDLLADFDALPTWKYATPHTIQRITPQNETCNACHGNDEIFLTAGDVPPDELGANRRVIVEEIPKPID